MVVKRLKNLTVLAVLVLVIGGGSTVAQADTAAPADPTNGRLDAFDPSAPVTDTIVRPGEGLFAIAERTRAPILGLISANNLKPPYQLSTGQTLKLPPLKVHLVQPGEGISHVAQRYGIDARSLRVFNRLPPNPVLRINQRIVLPPLVVDTLSGLEPQDLVDLIAADLVAGRPVSGQTMRETEASSVDRPLNRPNTLPEAQTALPTVPPVQAPPLQAHDLPPLPPRVAIPQKPAGKRFNWPVDGKIVETFGPKANFRQNDGIDIDAPRSSAFGAAADGTVAYVGNELPGYGWLVLVRHADNYITAYAYADEVIVKEGDAVTEGQTLGRVGTSGRATLPRLHFQIRKGTNPINPTAELPSAPVS